MDENKRLWTYLQYLEALKHQFALYMKSKNEDFPNSLLQQFKFKEAEEEAPADKGKNTAAKNERE